MPSSSLTLRIMRTEVSVILWKSGCSKQMSLRILITLFLTLMPVSYGKPNHLFVIIIILLLIITIISTIVIMTSSRSLKCCGKNFFNAFLPVSFRRACRSNARWSGAGWVQSFRLARRRPPARWWSCPSSGRGPPAARRTGETRGERSLHLKSQDSEASTALFFSRFIIHCPDLNRFISCTF